MQFPDNLTTANGAMVLIGGGGAGPENHLAAIFTRFIALAGGTSQPMVILTCATGNPQRQAARTAEFLSRQGATHLLTPLISTRAEADDPVNADLLRSAKAIYLTGGDQSKYLRVLNGTLCGEALRTAWESGCSVIGGTSAGAVVMGDVMIATSYDWIMRRRGVPLVRHGFGLLGRGVLVDSHFGQRRRIPRMLNVVRRLPGMLGIGLDEDTALVVDADGIGEVIGFSRVYFFVQRKERIAQTILSEGQRFDLRRMAVVNGERL